MTPEQLDQAARRLTNFSSLDDDHHHSPSFPHTSRLHHEDDKHVDDGHHFIQTDGLPGMRPHYEHPYYVASLLTDDGDSRMVHVPTVL